MADDFYSAVKRRLWTDARFRALSKPEPNARDMFLYLLTTPAATQIPGLLAIGEAAMADDLDWPVEGVRAALAELVASGMVQHDRTARLIWLPNAMKHNAPRSPDNVKGWAKHWRMLPECALRAEAGAAMMAAFVERGASFAAAFATASGLPMPAVKVAPKPDPIQDPTPEPVPGPKPDPKGDPKVDPKPEAMGHPSPRHQDQDQDQEKEQDHTHTPPARAHEEQPAGQADAAGDAPPDPDVPAVLAHLASMPPPVRHLASREYAERFVCAKMAGLALGDILAGITSAALKLGKHASATADQPETIASLADHVGGFVANQKRVGRRGGAIPLDDPDGVRRTQAYFGKAWEARKGRRYGAPDADLEHAVKLWDYAKKCAGEAKLKADGRDAPDAEAHVRSIVGQYLADDDRYVADRDHPIALLLSRLGRYGLPLAGARPATGPGIVIRPEDVAPIVRPPQPSADELRNMAATVAAGTGGAPLRRPSREAP